jgi:hypothetical protein
LTQRQRPSRRFVRLVLLLRAVWLLPVTALGLHYFFLNLYRLTSVMFVRHGDWTQITRPLSAAAAGAALLYFTWRIWRKTWLIVTDRLYPERSALAWQVVWIVLLLALPYWIYHG